MHNLAKTATPLLTATWPGANETDAWTNTYKGGRIFYTTLGHPGDFDTPQFRKLLVNAVFWALDKPLANGAEKKADVQPLPGTQPLTMEGDIASQLVDGVDKFL